MQYKLLTRVSYNKFSIQNCLRKRVANRNYWEVAKSAKAQDFDSCTS